jgi:putative SOS response-associated peptidase YedK
MPVILLPEAERKWLNPGYIFNNLAHYLEAYNQATMNIQEYQPIPPHQGSFFG